MRIALTRQRSTRITRLAFCSSTREPRPRIKRGPMRSASTVRNFMKKLKVKASSCSQGRKPFMNFLTWNGGSLRMITTHFGLNSGGARGGSDSLCFWCHMCGWISQMRLGKSLKLYGSLRSSRAFDLQTCVRLREMNSQVNWLLKV